MKVAVERIVVGEPHNLGTSFYKEVSNSHLERKEDRFEEHAQEERLG